MDMAWRSVYGGTHADVEQLGGVNPIDLLLLAAKWKSPLQASLPGFSSDPIHFRDSWMYVGGL